MSVPGHEGGTWHLGQEISKIGSVHDSIVISSLKISSNNRWFTYTAIEMGVISSQLMGLDIFVIDFEQVWIRPYCLQKTAPAS